MFQIEDDGPGFGHLAPEHGHGLVGVRRFAEGFRMPGCRIVQAGGIDIGILETHLAEGELVLRTIAISPRKPIVLRIRIGMLSRFVRRSSLSTYD